jgi:hypothetical protein
MGCPSWLLDVTEDVFILPSLVSTLETSRAASVIGIATVFDLVLVTR